VAASAAVAAVAAAASAVAASTAGTTKQPTYLFFDNPSVTCSY
jgi:hypothetical protein